MKRENIIKKVIIWRRNGIRTFGVSAREACLSRVDVWICLEPVRDSCLDGESAFLLCVDIYKIDYLALRWLPWEKLCFLFPERSRVLHRELCATGTDTSLLEQQVNRCAKGFATFWYPLINMFTEATQLIRLCHKSEGPLFMLYVCCWNL